MRSNLNKLFCLFLLILLFSACGSGDTSQSGGAEKKPAAPTSVHIGSFFTAVDYAPYLIARFRHSFEDSLTPKGIKIDYTEFQTLPSINEALATGKADLVFEAEPPAIIGRAANIDIQIRDISCSLVQEILVHPKSKIKSIADLKGKKIAVLAGTSSHYGVLKLLKNNNIPLASVQIIDMSPPDAKAAFESGQVDAWAVWPPFVEQETVGGMGRTLPKGDAYINSIMAVRGSFVKENPETFATIDHVYNITKQWMEANPDSAMSIVSQQLNVPLKIIQAAWPVHHWKVQLDSGIIADIQAKADFLKDTKKIQNAVQVKDSLIPAYTH